MKGHFSYFLIIPGYLGKDCNATVSVDGNWGEWGQWSECDTYPSKQTRTRACDDPPPSGGGWYCSKDGSYSYEERDCTDGACQVAGKSKGNYANY